MKGMTKLTVAAMIGARVPRASPNPFDRMDKMQHLPAPPAGRR